MLSGAKLKNFILEATVTNWEGMGADGSFSVNNLSRLSPENSAKYYNELLDVKKRMEADAKKDYRISQIAIHKSELAKLELEVGE